jgi:hypothetical protein
MKIGPYLLVDTGNEGEKKFGKPKQWYNAKYCPSDHDQIWQG